MKNTTRTLNQPISFKNLKIDDVVTLSDRPGKFTVKSIVHAQTRNSTSYVKLQSRKNQIDVRESDIRNGYIVLTLVAKLFD
jgi:hypothetical protein